MRVPHQLTKIKTFTPFLSQGVGLPCLRLQTEFIGDAEFEPGVPDSLVIGSAVTHSP